MLALASAQRDKKMTLPTSFYGQTINDNTVNSAGTPTSTSWEVPVSPIDAATYDPVTSLIATLSTAVDGIIIGVIAKDNVISDRNLFSVSPAGVVEAQRENKWLVRYHNPSNFKKYQVSIGTADLSLLTSGSEFLDINTTGTPGLAFKNAFQAAVVCPDDEAVHAVVDSVQFVGRNT